MGSCVAMVMAACTEAPADEIDLQDVLEPDHEAMAQEHREREEHIAECMAEQGFDYEPRQPPDIEAAPMAGHREDLDEEEFVEEYGYGISTWEPHHEPMPEPPEDPNEEIREQMDEAELEAWEEALHGDMPEPGEAQPEEPIEPGGCMGEAFEEMQGGHRNIREQLPMDELVEAVHSDPRIVEANEAWAQCMQERGWDGVSDPHDAREMIFDEYSDVREVPEIHPLADPEEAEEMEHPEPEVDEAALAELQERELDVAADDYQCRQDVGLDEVREEVRDEHEAEFVEEHREALEELQDS